MLMTRPATMESQYLVRKRGMADVNQSSWLISRKFGLLGISSEWKNGLTFPPESPWLPVLTTGHRFDAAVTTYYTLDFDMVPASPRLA